MAEIVYRPSPPATIEIKPVVPLVEGALTVRGETTR